ncbi:MAG TPA: aminoacyl-tRNA hydrolase [Thermoanaerobaculia bacterium]|nr:aminoacyl-tRNA hydrolase [Thermoanaerobaculia bacterium]
MERLILGLGNPGERYCDTRHNVGFFVVEELARRWGVRLDRRECNAFVGGPGGDQSTLLALPQTYMNRSGWAARCLLESHGLDPAGVLVVYDEVALPLGKLRLRKSGSPGGHRGLESVIENLRTDQVPRLRLGVSPEDGPPRGEDLVEFVLAPFPPGERETVEAMVARAADACEAWVKEGAEAAMMRFNG